MPELIQYRSVEVDHIPIQIAVVMK